MALGRIGAGLLLALLATGAQGAPLDAYGQLPGLDMFTISPNGKNIGGRPLVQYNYSRSLYDFADLEGSTRIARCNDNDPNDPYPKIQNCPVNQYTERGPRFRLPAETIRDNALMASGLLVEKVGLAALCAVAAAIS